MTRTWLAGLLAAALLGAWQEALLHPLEHVDEHGRFVHLYGADGSDTRGENRQHDAPSEPSDKLGDTLAALTACAPGAAQLFDSGERPEHSPPSAFQDAPRAAAAPPFRAQAPPSLL